MDRNLMTGIWFDWMNANNRVHDNVAAYNSGFGIHYEASQKGYIYNNYVFGNKQHGIYLPHSAESVVAHNAHSWTETLEIPAEIREAIQAKKTIPQWPENKR